MSFLVRRSVSGLGGGGIVGELTGRGFPTDTGTVGVCWDYNNQVFWVTNTTTDGRRSYDVSGTSQSPLYSINDIAPAGIEKDTATTNVLWVIGKGSNTGIKLVGTNSGASVITSIVANGESNPSAVCMVDAASIWILGTVIGSAMKFNNSGIYQGVTIPLGIGDITGACWDGRSFWVVSITDDKVHQFDSNWVATGFSFPVNPNSRDITFYRPDKTLWVSQAFDNNIVEYK